MSIGRLVVVIIATAGVTAFAAAPGLAKSGGSHAGASGLLTSVSCEGLSSDASLDTVTAITDGDALRLPVPKERSGIFVQQYGAGSSDDLSAFRNGSGDLKVRNCGLPFVPEPTPTVEEPPPPDEEPFLDDPPNVSDPPPPLPEGDPFSLRGQVRRLRHMARPAPARTAASISSTGSGTALSSGASTPRARRLAPRGRKPRKALSPACGRSRARATTAVSPTGSARLSPSRVAPKRMSRSTTAAVSPRATE